jgi:hypothetical protein
MMYLRPSPPVAPEVRELVLLIRPDRYVAAAFALADAAGAARDFEAIRAATWGEFRAVALKAKSQLQKYAGNALDE